MVTINPKCLMSTCAHECTIGEITVTIQGSEIIKRFKDIPIDLDDHFAHKFVSYKATGIRIGGVCLQSYPCKHDCQITYQNGKQVSQRLSGQTIVDLFSDLLNEKGKAHFAYLCHKGDQGNLSKD
jgi:hypothetical protein